MPIFSVIGMTCGHCEKAVTNAIRALDASAEVRIDRPNGIVDVTSSASNEALCAAIEEEGYGAVEVFAAK